jgi:hypothetical protein
MTAIKDLRELVGAVGLLPSAMDRELGAARADNPPVDSNPHIIKAHNMLADIGRALDTVAKGLAALDTDAPKPPQPSQPAQPAGLPPPLTGTALRYVLTGQVTRNGSYWLPGVEDPELVKWYVNAYAPSQGGVYSSVFCSTVAQMSDADLAQNEAKYPNVADFMRASRYSENYIKTQVARTPTWAVAKKMSGR